MEKICWSPGPERVGSEARGEVRPRADCPSIRFISVQEKRLSLSPSLRPGLLSIYLSFVISLRGPQGSSPFGSPQATNFAEMHIVLLAASFRSWGRVVQLPGLDLGQVAQKKDKGFNAANLGLQINKYFGAMREEDSRAGAFGSTAPFSSNGCYRDNQPASMLVEQIQDQQIYLCLTSTLLRMAKEAGASEEALKEVSHSLLARRGFKSPPMMALSKQPLDEEQKRRECYEWLDNSCTANEEKNILSQLERLVLESREREDHYRSLVQYKADKSDEVAPTASGGPNSRKERFRRLVRERSGRNAVESSDFYKFEVNEMLQNSYRYENECYRTVGSFTHLKTMFGHASEADLETYSQIFNLVLDRTQNLIITGGQEGLIKIWHRGTGALIANLKGHSDFLNKVDTSRCNKYIISSAGDGIRFFDLRSLRPLGGWKTSSIAEVSSFLQNGKNYFLFGDNSYLYVLTEEIMLASSQRRLELSDFYKFYYGDITGRTNTSILVISLAPQKRNLLLGLQNGQLMMVFIDQLLAQIEAHQPGDDLTLPCLEPVKAHSEDIIEVKWSNRDDLWATGGKDGRCCLWEVSNNKMQLLTSLSVSTKGQRGRRKKQSYSCTYICWNCVYSHFAAGFQENVDEEDSDRGRGEVLVYSLKEGRVTCELSRDVSQQYGGVRAMDAHPYFPNILLIGQSDGHILLFDIFVGCIVNTFEERGFHLLHPQFQLIPSECHFAKDGLSFVVATEYGSISIYGYDSKCFYTGTPLEQFLQTDFQQFTIQDETMKAIPLTLESKDDINEYPRGELLSIRGHRHPYTITVHPEMLLRALRQPVSPAEHRPQYLIDTRFLEIIQHNLKENEIQEQIYQKTYEEIERMKSLVLFHERQRQYLFVSNLIKEKLKVLKAQGGSGVVDENAGEVEDRIIAEQPRRTRKLQRHPERQVVNYVDDFQYHDSQEEDYNAEDSFLEQDIPEQLQEDYSQDDEDNAGRRRRHVRTNRRETRRHDRPQYDMAAQIEDYPEVMTRRRRRDIIEEPHEIQNEAPKKRQKLEEDSSEQRAYSRLKKQINEHLEAEQMEANGECFRCQLSKPTAFCYGCPYSQQFCDECSKLRGKRQRERYNCLICIFLKNSTNEDYENVSEENYRIVNISQDCYVPQIEDKVRFFFQGYEEFLVQNVNRLNSAAYRDNEAFRLLPHAEENSLVNTPLCEVVSIQYYFPVRSEHTQQLKRNPGKGEKTQIEMVIGLRSVDSGQLFWVFFWPGQQFLLREEIFQQIEDKNLISRLTINDLVVSKDEEMQIVQISPFEDRFPETIWKVIKVRKTEGKRLRCNTKEIEKQVNVWKISSGIVQPERKSNIPPAHLEQLESQLQQLLKEDSPFSIFNDYVDFDIYPEYRQLVPVGMCLQTILQRLQNKYYTGELSLKHDIDLILTNSLKFNGPNHKVTQDAHNLSAVLHALIQSQEVPHPEIKSPREQSTTKKQKKVKQEENPSFEGPDEVVTKKKEDHHNPHRKKRRQSSDYQQDSFSPEHFSIGVSTRRGRTRNGHREQPRRVTRSGARH